MTPTYYVTLCAWPLGEVSAEVTIIATLPRNRYLVEAVSGHPFAGSDQGNGVLAHDIYWYNRAVVFRHQFINPPELWSPPARPLCDPEESRDVGFGENGRPL